MTHSILISGAGVAGLSTAYWLRRFGFAPTLLEKYPDASGGGQAVDIRGVALDVVAAMGLLDAVRGRRTRLRGMSMIDRNGNELQRDTTRTFSGGELDSDDIEVFRDTLCALLLRSVGDVEMRLGDTITALRETTDGVDVAFAGSDAQRFDLIVGADGLHSNVRRLAMPDQTDCVRHFGAMLGLFTAPNLLELHEWELMYREPTRGLVIYPTPGNAQLRVGVGFAADEDASLRGNVQAQKALMAAHCRDFGGTLAPLMAHLATATQFYLGDVAQVHLPAWSRGHVALVGDAAHCASPFSGQGTSLALIGGYVFARSLARHADDPARAFAEYEHRMRPFVQLNQALVDLTREGPIPDEQMTRAKRGIDLGDLDEIARAAA